MASSTSPAGTHRVGDDETDLAATAKGIANDVADKAVAAARACPTRRRRREPRSSAPTR